MTTPPLSAQEAWFESIWAQREETIYAALFGNRGAGIYTLPLKLFERLGFSQPDPRFLTHGLFECPPTAGRLHWAYVSSGMSNPWGESAATANPDGPSGLGFEFLLLTPEQSPWAIGTLHWLMAIQLLVAAGLIKGELLNTYDRVPLGTSIDHGRPESPLRNLLLTPPPAPLPPQFALPSGKVDLLLCLGVTDQEYAFGRTQGGPELLGLLTHHRVYPVSDPGRRSVI